jgi:predicted secreted Zn-dependent protease
MRISVGLVVVVAALATACASFHQTPEQLRVEQAWSACQQDGRIPLQVRLTRIEPNGRYWISGDAGTFGFQDTQVCMSEKFRLPVVATSVADAVKVKVNRSTQYYSVRGETTQEILGSLHTNSPMHVDGKRASGVTSGSGRLAVACSPYTITIELNLLVTLPQHDQLDGLSEELKTRWQGLVASVTAHEERHVEIYRDTAQTMKNRMEAISISRPCEDIQQEIQSIWTTQQDEMKAAQARFDAEDAARVDMNRQPFRAQIDSNQARLAAMESEVRDLDRTANDLRRQLGTVQNNIESVAVEMRKANASLSSCPQARPTQPIGALCQQHSNLVAASDRLVQQLDGAMSRRSALVNEHAQVRTATNDLVDAYN